MSTDGGFGTGGNSDAQQSLQSFWPRVMEEIRNLTVVSVLAGWLVSEELTAKSAWWRDKSQLERTPAAYGIQRSWLFTHCKGA